MKVSRVTECNFISYLYARSVAAWFSWICTKIDIHILAIWGCWTVIVWKVLTLPEASVKQLSVLSLLDYLEMESAHRRVHRRTSLAKRKRARCKNSSPSRRFAHKSANTISLGPPLQDNALPQFLSQMQSVNVWKVVLNSALYIALFDFYI